MFFRHLAGLLQRAAVRDASSARKPLTAPAAVASLAARARIGPFAQETVRSTPLRERGKTNAGQWHRAHP